MILCACIHDPSTGIHYPGLRHSEIISEIVREKHGWPNGLILGFVDEEGNFHDRRQALRIAIACEQWGLVEPINPALLHSEDIY